MGIREKQREIYQQAIAGMQARLDAGETLRGVAFASQSKTFSITLFVIGTTDQRLILQPVDRRWQAKGDPTIVRRGEVTDSSVWGWSVGEASTAQKIRTFATSNGQEIKFQANGEKFKLMSLGGNMLENMMASDEQLVGVQALIEFLSS
jgi:hypothetical protein